jgi:site-specific DNA-methyltransferase (adenine-specific)
MSDIKLIKGDCLVEMKNIPDKSIDMILADLPYGTTACKWDSVIPFEPLWKEYKRLIKANGCIVLMCGEPFTSQLINSNLPMFRYKWIWDKKFAGNFVTANKRPLNTFEEIVVFYNNQPTYNPQKTKREKPITSGKRCHPRNRTGTEENVTYEAEKKTYDDKHPTTIINIPRKIGKGTNHPTEKPTELMEYLIRTYTNENELVLDNTAGSCTTAIAALNTNRNYICMEKEERYYNIGLKRVKEWHENKKFEPQTLFGNGMGG